MRKAMTKSLLVLSGLCVGGIAQAELTANVGVTTNYVFRGQTQTDDGPAIQGGVDYVHELNQSVGIYAGAWGSNVEDSAGNDGFEYDLYAGIQFEFAKDAKFDIGFIMYEYTDDAFNNAEADEIYVGASVKGFSIYYYDGDLDRSNDDYSYIDLRYTMPLPEDIFLTLHYGHKDYDSSSDADDIGVRVSKAMWDIDWSLSFTSWDNDQNDESELFLTATKTFNLGN